MSDYWDQLMKETSTVPTLRGSKRGLPKTGMAEVPLPRVTYTPVGKQERYTLGELMVAMIQAGEKPEVAFNKCLYRGTRHPGATRKGVMRYLLRELEKAQEEGRLGGI